MESQSSKTANNMLTPAFDKFEVNQAFVEKYVWCKNFLGQFYSSISKTALKIPNTPNLYVFTDSIYLLLFTYLYYVLDNEPVYC